MGKKKFSIINIGTTSILTVFVVLCMVTFGTLSFVNANHDYQVSKNYGEKITNYYTAVSKANHKMKDWNETFQKQAQKGTLEKGKVVSFSIPIDDTSRLDVGLTICEQKEDGTYYHISTFKKVSTQEWNGDTSIEVMQP